MPDGCKCQSHEIVLLIVLTLLLIPAVISGYGLIVGIKTGNTKLIIPCLAAFVGSVSGIVILLTFYRKLTTTPPVIPEETEELLEDA